MSIFGGPVLDGFVNYNAFISFIFLVSFGICIFFRIKVKKELDVEGSKLYPIYFFTRT